MMLERLRLCFLGKCCDARVYTAAISAFALQERRGEDGQDAPSLKEALRDFQQRHLKMQTPGLGKASHAASEVPDLASALAAAAGQQPGSRIVLGYVTSEAPRGVLGRGACGVCLGASLGALRAQQTPGKKEHGILVAYRSPLSSVLRLAEARTVW